MTDEEIEKAAEDWIGDNETDYMSSASYTAILNAFSAGYKKKSEEIHAELVELAKWAEEKQSEYYLKMTNPESSQSQFISDTARTSVYNVMAAKIRKLAAKYEQPGKLNPQTTEEKEMIKTIAIAAGISSDTGMRVKWKPAENVLEFDGWYDGSNTIEGRRMYLFQFFNELGITEEDCRKALSSQENETE